MIEFTVFSLFNDLQALPCEKGIPLFDIVDRMDIVRAVPMEELSMYLNEFYELNMKTYGIEDMRITMKRKAGSPADDEMNKEEGGAAMETLLEIVMEIVMEGTLYTVGNKKVSLWIRIPLILVLSLFFGFLITGCFLTGISIMKEEGFFMGLVMLGISFLMLAALMKLIIDHRKKRR